MKDRSGFPWATPRPPWNLHEWIGWKLPTRESVCTASMDVDRSPHAIAAFVSRVKVITTGQQRETTITIFHNYRPMEAFQSPCRSREERTAAASFQVFYDNCRLTAPSAELFTRDAWYRDSEPAAKSREVNSLYKFLK